MLLLLTGVQRIREDGTTDADDGAVNGLWNAQPYPPQPSVPVPQPEAGCSRAQALELKRMSHGTGAHPTVAVRSLMMGIALTVMLKARLALSLWYRYMAQGIHRAMVFIVVAGVQALQQMAACVMSAAVPTGNGYTTVKGFWIPDPPASPPAPAAALIGGGGGSAGAGAAAGGTAGGGITAAPAPASRRPGPKRRGRGGRITGAAAAAAAAKAAAKAAAGAGGGFTAKAAPAALRPAKVDLIAMPDDLPDELPVVCCGRHGLLYLRAQTVLHSGAVMTVSHFERICGRGDAKKWKASLL